MNIVTTHLKDSLHEYGVNEYFAREMAENLFEDFLPASVNNKETNKNEILGLLKIAKEDLDASKSLYKDHKYRQAVLLFQQATEKSIKSLFYTIIL